MTLFHWSQVAANNGTADITCPFPEGQGAPTLNDGARGMMAAVAKYRDDIAGGIVTTGTSTAYAVSSFQQFDSLTDMNGAQVAFSPHVTNGATVTLNVDGLGVKPLRSAPGVELLAGALVLGAPYTATYNNTDGAWYLHSAFGNLSWSTGDVKLTLKTTADPGWVMFNDGTIGDGSSSLPASARGNPDTLALFTLLYAAPFTDTSVKVFTSNGTLSSRAALGSATAAFAAHALMQLPLTLGRALAIAGSGVGLSARALGSNTGAEFTVLTAAELPSFSTSGNNTITVTTAQKVVNGPNQGSATPGGSQVTAADPGSGGALSLVNSSGINAIGTSFINNSQAAVPTVPPESFMNAMVKL